ncbi:MAG: TIGR01777 family oxidoreductase [Thermoplasmatales archaeon]
MRYIVAGGTGFIGRHLSRELETIGDKVTTLTRGEKTDGDYIRWDPQSRESLKDIDVGSFDVVVNLSGAGIEKRWSSRYKEILLNSRIETTSALVALINSSERKPRYFVNASAIGYYGNVDYVVDEDSPPGEDFLAKLCLRWEGEAKKLVGSVKLLIPRFGIVLGDDGGALPKLETMVRYRVAPKNSGHNFWKSWIAVVDASRSIPFMISKEFSGHYNAVSPHPATLNDFINEIYSHMGRKPLFRFGKNTFKMLLGEGSEYSIFGGQNVKPRRLEELGFKFRYEDLGSAIRGRGE